MYYLTPNFLVVNKGSERYCNRSVHVQEMIFLHQNLYQGLQDLSWPLKSHNVVRSLRRRYTMCRDKGADKCRSFLCCFLWKKFWGHRSFLWIHWCLNFWWHLPLGSNLGWIPSLPCFIACVKWIPQIHLWCDTCWPLGGQHGGQSFSVHVLGSTTVCILFGICVLGYVGTYKTILFL